MLTRVVRVTLRIAVCSVRTSEAGPPFEFSIAVDGRLPCGQRSREDLRMATQAATKDHQVVALRPECPASVTRRTARASPMRVLRVTVTVGAIAYAGYSVYQQKVVTFRDIATGVATARDWVMTRSARDDEIVGALRELRRERDDLRRNQRQMIDRQRVMEQALHACLAKRARPSEPRPQPRPNEWPWDVFKGTGFRDSTANPLFAGSFLSIA